MFPVAIWPREGECSLMDDCRDAAWQVLSRKYAGVTIRLPALGISPVVGRLTLAQEAEVRILYPQPIN